jgi:hypothetical protein
MNARASAAIRRESLLALLLDKRLVFIKKAEGGR